jgi:hypothetical protein
MLISILLAGCIGDDSNDNEHTSHQYSLEIDVNQTGKFIIYTPLPLSWSTTEAHEKEVSEVINKLKIINGNVNFSVIETEYGYALKIEGNGDLNIEGSSDVESTVMKNPLSLSLTNYTFEDNNRKYWIFADFENYNQNISISIDFHLKGNKQFEEIKIKGNLINGWQQIDGEYSLIT